MSAMNKSAVAIYHSNEPLLSGENYLDLERKARKIHSTIAKRTKRTPYIRSTYFHKSKIFIKPFWEHLNQKSQSDRRRRLKYYAAAIDLLRHSTIEPTTKINPNGKKEIVHRFTGQTKTGEIFYVQVKQDKRTDNKYFMSVFAPR